MMRRNGDGPSGLTAGPGSWKKSGGKLTLFECLVESVELWKNGFAVAVVLGAWLLRLWVCVRIGSSAKR
jgi:hypothetical protein